MISNLDNDLIIPFPLYNYFNKLYKWFFDRLQQFFAKFDNRKPGRTENVTSVKEIYGYIRMLKN